jgi:hypothetical protein
MTTLIPATQEANGVRMSPDKHNPAMYNVVKYSLSGRSNGTIFRYNSNTGNINYDGSSWRTYVNYNHATEEEILSIIKKSL